MIIDSGVITGSLVVSGSYSQTGSAVISGNLTVLGALNATISGSATSASYARNADTASFAPSYLLTSSFDNFSGSASTRLTNLESFSSSLDVTFATDAQLNAATASLSASLAIPIAQLAATASTLTSASASFVVASGSTSTRLTNLESFSSSLDVTFATDAQLNAATASLSASLAIPIAALQVTASTLTSASASFASNITNLQNVTGSYATTGSNQFKSSQVITGSLTIATGVFTLGKSQMAYSDIPSTSAGNNSVFATNTGSFAGAFYQYTLYKGSNARSENATVVWTPTTSSYTNYSTIDVGDTSDVVGSVVIVGGQVQLNILTPTAGWTIRAVATFV